MSACGDSIKYVEHVGPDPKRLPLPETLGSSPTSPLNPWTDALAPASRRVIVLKRSRVPPGDHRGEPQVTPTDQSMKGQKRLPGKVGVGE